MAATFDAVMGALVGSLTRALAQRFGADDPLIGMLVDNLRAASASFEASERAEIEAVIAVILAESQRDQSPESIQ